MTSQEAAYHELCCYTLTLGDPAFLHQHVVDAFAAQDAREQDRPIRLTFALIGLYLHVEQKLSGKQVQRVHMALARRKRPWPSFARPEDRGVITAADVLAVPAGPGRDRMIHDWCACVWAAFRENRPLVVALLAEHAMDVTADS